MLNWEFFRFVLCHALLVISSTLAISLGIYRPRKRDFPLLGLYFFAMLGLVLLNNALCIITGIHPAEGSIYESLKVMNPCWVFGPPEGFEWVRDVAAIFSPDAWVGKGSSGTAVPFLWCFIPMYSFITAMAYLIYTPLAERKNVELSQNEGVDSNEKLVKNA